MKNKVIINNKTPILLKGLPVSRGIAIGKSYVIEHGKNIVKEKYIEKTKINAEIKKIDKGLDINCSIE